MEKRGVGIIQGVFTSIAFILILAIFSGCSDKKLEEKNRQLNSKLIRVNAYNIQLSSKIESLTHKNQNCEKKLSALRDNNKNLDISLAKSNLLFEKKHQAEYKAQRDKLDKERDALRQEKQRVQNEAYANAESSVKYKYLSILGIAFVLIVLLGILSFAERKKKNREIKNLEEEKEKYRMQAIEFSKLIEDLERKQQAGSINQVVSEINMSHTRRKELLDSLKEGEDGN